MNLKSIKRVGLGQLVMMEVLMKKLSEDCQHVDCFPCEGKGIVYDGFRVESGFGPNGEQVPIPEQDVYPCPSCRGTGKVIIVLDDGS